MQRKQKNFQLISTEDGLHLQDSVLWFDAYSNSGLSFISAITEKVRKHIKPQVIATAETIKIIEIFHDKIHALICPYNRPFSIGPLRIELLPSGHVLGGAILYVESQSLSLLYAPAIQSQKSPLQRQLQVRRANTLILGAYDPPHNTQGLSEAELLEQVEKMISQDMWPIIACSLQPTAQKICRLLRGWPTAVHRQIYRINKIYEYSNIELGSHPVLSSRRRARDKIILIPDFALKNPLWATTDRPHILVHEGYSKVQVPKNGKEITLKKNQNLGDFISKVQPKELFFFGTYAKEYAEIFQKSAAQVKALFINDQPPLF